jgi:hypothetical protein
MSKDKCPDAPKKPPAKPHYYGPPIPFNLGDDGFTPAPNQGLTDNEDSDSDNDVVGFAPGFHYDHDCG